MTRLSVLAAAALVAAFLMPAAKAQQQPLVCQPHHKISEHLRQAYGEVVVVTGLAGSDALFELFASEKNGTWTVIITRPSMGNLSCIQGAGTDFSLTGNESPPPKSDPA